MVDAEARQDLGIDDPVLHFLLHQLDQQALGGFVGREPQAAVPQLGEQVGVVGVGAVLDVVAEHPHEQLMEFGGDVGIALVPDALWLAVSGEPSAFQR